MPNPIPDEAKMTVARPTLDQVLDEAAAEWEMQACLPDSEPAGMSETAREGYLHGRLIGHLQTILLISGRLNP